MEITTAEDTNCNIVSEYITEEEIKLIISKHTAAGEENVIENFNVTNASDKMLGFLCDYWKLQVNLRPSNKVLRYFIKVVSVTNAAKTEMVQKLKLFDKEFYFYAVIKRSIEIPDLRPWSAKFVTDIMKSALVFEDMSAHQYKLRDKFKRFDMVHTLEALKTLTRFHASSIIYEENKSKELGRSYSINEDFCHQLHDAGYVNTDNWFILCMKAAIDAIKVFSNYSNEQIQIIESRWFNVWSSGLDLSNPTTECRSVICHRDLWNNNLMFHYKKVGDEMVPDDCVLVDFQAAKYQPPAGDVMLLLYCNLDPQFREDNMDTLLNFYLDELSEILANNEIDLKVINRERFFESAEKQRLWAVVVCACLMPQFWINDEILTETFCNAEQFDDILSKNKSGFVTKMMKNNLDYKEKVMNIFEEIVERYCL